MRNHKVTHSADRSFAALADPTRRALLDLLRAGGQPAGQIAQSFPISRPAISKHLRLLRQAHLEHYRIFWNTKLAGLKSFVESDPAAAVKKPKNRRS